MIRENDHIFSEIIIEIRNCYNTRLSINFCSLHLTSSNMIIVRCTNIEKNNHQTIRSSEFERCVCIS